MKTCFYSIFLLSTIAFVGASATDPIIKPSGKGIVKVQVTQKGKNVGGQVVWIFKAGDVKCVCFEGKCQTNSVDDGLTAADSKGSGTEGQVVFEDLAPNIKFIAMIGVSCNQAQTPCQGNQNCGINQGPSATFETDKKGSAALVVIPKP